MRLELASLSHVGGWAEQPLGKEARILLVSEDLRELAYYHAILEKLGCKVRPSSSFAEGARHLGCEPFDLIMVDQGSGNFEGQKVLAQAMEVDLELRVLVLARTYHKGCHLEAMRSGALDYLEGPLSAADIVALLDTFVPRRSEGHSVSQNRSKGAKPSKERMTKVKSNWNSPGEVCDMRLEGKVEIVTAGGMRIGCSASQLLARDGAKVSRHERRRQTPGDRERNHLRRYDPHGAGLGIATFGRFSAYRQVSTLGHLMRSAA